MTGEARGAPAFLGKVLHFFVSAVHTPIIFPGETLPSREKIVRGKSAALFQNLALFLFGSSSLPLCHFSEACFESDLHRKCDRCFHGVASLSPGSLARAGATDGFGAAATGDRGASFTILGMNCPVLEWLKVPSISPIPIDLSGQSFRSSSTDSYRGIIPIEFGDLRKSWGSRLTLIGG